MLLALFGSWSISIFVRVGMSRCWTHAGTSSFTCCIETSCTAHIVLANAVNQKGQHEWIIKSCILLVYFDYNVYNVLLKNRSCHTLSL
jgi:hypothetical protein